MPGWNHDVKAVLLLCIFMSDSYGKTVLDLKAKSFIPLCVAVGEGYSSGWVGGSKVLFWA